MLIVVSRLLNLSSSPMHPEPSMSLAVAPLSQTAFGPLQHPLMIVLISGDTDRQSPWPRLVAAMFRLAATTLALQLELLWLEMKGLVVVSDGAIVFDRRDSGRGLD